MRIEHIAMYVNDLEKEKEFFEIYFGAKAGNKYVHEEIGFSSNFLEFQDGARLELMHRVEMDDIEKSRNRTASYISHLPLAEKRTWIELQK